MDVLQQVVVAEQYMRVNNHPFVIDNSTNFLEKTFSTYTFFVRRYILLISVTKTVADRPKVLKHHCLIEQKKQIIA